MPCSVATWRCAQVPRSYAFLRHSAADLRGIAVTSAQVSKMRTMSFSDAVQMRRMVARVKAPPLPMAPRRWRWMRTARRGWRLRRSYAICRRRTRYSICYSVADYGAPAAWRGASRGGREERRKPASEYGERVCRRHEVPYGGEARHAVARRCFAAGGARPRSEVRCRAFYAARRHAFFLPFCCRHALLQARR